MPNRIIRESIRTSESINELKPMEEILFYRLIVSCDDYGRFDGRPAIIKGTCFPLKDVTVKDIEKAIAKLSTVGMIILYEVDGKPYVQLTTWEQYQTVRAKKSKYPECSSSNMLASANICKHMQADVSVIQSESKSESYSESETITGDVRVDVAFNDYVKFRAKIGKPMTDRAVQLAVAKLNGFSAKPVDQIEIINQSIANGWTGLYELKSDKKQKAKNGNKFNNFEQREYDYSSLEAQLLDADK